jgi:hypothetical protein
MHRLNATEIIWMQTNSSALLHQDRWIKDAMEHLKVRAVICCLTATLKGFSFELESSRSSSNLLSSLLQFFEGQLVTAMKDDGWNGYEEANNTQWSLAGSLFYSIIVITTIGESFLPQSST